MRAANATCLAAATVAIILTMAAGAASVHAVEMDASCAPILKAVDAQLKVGAWRRKTVMHLAGRTMTMETIEAGGAVYNRREEGAWMKLPLSAAQLEVKALEMMKSGETRVSGCKRVGLETVGAVPTTVFEYTVAAMQTKPITSRIWIGVLDNLPYRLSTPVMEQVIEYKGVSAPKL
jgi:hypothetical protein